MEPIKILYISTPEDRDLRDQLEKHLMILKRINQVTLRLTRDILAGTNWSHEQDERFQRADLFLLLVSADLVASDYHYGIEMHNAIEKHDAGHAWVIPIILRPIPFPEQLPFGKLQMLPQNGVPVTKHTNQDDAFVDIVKRISEIVANLLVRKYGPPFSAKAGTSTKDAQAIVFICETCKVQNSSGIIICRNCGDMLLTDAEASLFTPGSAAGLRCPKCGFENRPGAKFCRSCSQSLNQDTQTVPLPTNRPQASPSSTQQNVWAIQARLAQGWNIQTCLPGQRIWETQRRKATWEHPVSGIQPPQMDSYNQGVQNMYSGKYTDAIAWLKKAAVPGQLSYQVVYCLGVAYRQLAHSSKQANQKLYRENLLLALELLETAVALKTDMAEFYFHLGLSYSDLEMYNQASSALQSALQLSSQYDNKTAIYFHLGHVASQQGYVQEAETYFIEGLKLSPQDVYLLVSLGDLYLKMNQTKSAVDVLSTARQINPQMWEVWYELGRALMVAKEWKSALSALERGRQESLKFQLLPVITNFCSAMAQCYLNLNNKLSARVMINEALQGDPNNAEALEVQGQL